MELNRKGLLLLLLTIADEERMAGSICRSWWRQDKLEWKRLTWFPKVKEKVTSIKSLEHSKDLRVSEPDSEVVTCKLVSNLRKREGGSDKTLSDWRAIRLEKFEACTHWENRLLMILFGSRVTQGGRRGGWRKANRLKSAFLR